jgi:hypothetical protein
MKKPDVENLVTLSLKAASTQIMHADLNKPLPTKVSVPKFFIFNDFRLFNCFLLEQWRLTCWDFFFYMIHSQISWPRSGDCGGAGFEPGTAASSVCCRPVALANWATTFQLSLWIKVVKKLMSLDKIFLSKVGLWILNRLFCFMSLLLHSCQLQYLDTI